ncbi:helix-turn-helix domain-containing protein [Cypionkella psychrotolerans]|uniref:helix-turn-helix domain-containing protein n=1 Tax=Cypionkella psychrotolerans TaxID=1678131 RepID=UPI0006B569C9|nr:hypothetical protein [Cypionkella psychrotolerans]
MLTNIALHELLEARRKELGLSHMQLGVKAFAREDASTLHNIKRGSSPTYERLGQIVEAMGWEVYIGPTRKSGFSEAGVDGFSTASAQQAGYLPIPWLDAGAGKGSSPVSFQIAFLDQLGLQVERLRAIKPDEVFVESGLGKGFVAIIDPLAPRKGMAMWAHRLNGKTTVSMVAFDPPAAMIMPLTNTHAPKLISEISSSNVRFLGRVDLLVRAA